MDPWKRAQCCLELTIFSILTVMCHYIEVKQMKPLQLILGSLHFVVCVQNILILCLWFLASLIYINNCPTRCNTKQSVYYSASSFYMLRVSTTPIIRSTQNCNYSPR